MYKEIYDILIVEDEFINSQFVEQVLSDLGHNIVGNVKNASSAIKISNNNSIDLIFMDINLEDNIDGILCSKLINKYRKIPIIFITAFKDSATLKTTMDTNMYGYLLKPFDGKDIEIILSVAIRQLIIEKNREYDLRYIDLGNSYNYNQERKTLYLGNTPISLTRNEFKIIDILFNNLNQNVSYKILENYIWGDKEITISTIRDTVLRLRKKAPKLNLVNISGFGYCLKDV